MSKRVIRILGIDPGLRRTGWGLIECEGNRLIFVACGSVDTNNDEDVATRLVCDPRRPRAHHRAAQARRSRGRSHLRQQGCGRHAQARPGARRRHADPRARRFAGRRIRAQSRQENHRRRGACRESADPHDDRRAAPQSRSENRGRRRRARHRGDACASPARPRSSGRQLGRVSSASARSDKDRHPDRRHRSAPRG